MDDLLPAKSFSHGPIAKAPRPFTDSPLLAEKAERDLRWFARVADLLFEGRQSLNKVYEQMEARGGDLSLVSICNLAAIPPHPLYVPNYPPSPPLLSEPNETIKKFEVAEAAIPLIESQPNIPPTQEELRNCLGEFFPFLVRILRRRFRYAGDIVNEIVNEAAQNAAVKALASIESGDAALRTNRRSWLVTVGVNEARTAFRKRDTLKEISLGDDVVTIAVDSKIDQIETEIPHDQDLLRSSLEMLTTEERNLIEAYHYRGETEREIADRLGINHGNVNRWLVRTRIKLKNIYIELERIKAKSAQQEIHVCVNGMTPEDKIKYFKSAMTGLIEKWHDAISIQERIHAMEKLIQLFQFINDSDITLGSFMKLAEVKSFREIMLQIIGPHLAGGTPGNVLRRQGGRDISEIKHLVARDVIRKILVITQDEKEQEKIYREEFGSSLSDFSLRKSEVESGRFD